MMEVIRVNIPEPTRAKDLFKKIETYRKRSCDMVQIFDCSMVISEEHIRWAYRKAVACFNADTNIAESLEIETILWASAEEQIKDALIKMGLSDGSEEAVVLIDGDTDAFLEEMGWELSDKGIEPSKEKLSNFGITKAEIDSTDKPFDLIFEKMATSRL